MTEQPGSADEPPRVFVSYSDDSPTHAQRVLELAQWLRSHGVDAHIDQFEDSPEEGWPRWIYRQIRESEFVLVIATPGYLRRCVDEVARTRGADPAVRFESHLSLQELHEAGGRNRKFVPVLFDDDAIVESVPLPLRGATCYRLPAQRDDLYRRLTGQPKVRRAPLGQLKTFDDESLLESSEDYHYDDSLRARREHARRGRGALDEQRAEDSLRAVVDAGLLDEPGGPERPRVPSNWRRSWFQAHRQQLVGVGAFALAFLAVGLYLGRQVQDHATGDPQCRIQLTNPDGTLIQGIDYVELVLPSGHEIEVEVEDGDTLRFKCPPTTTQAQAHVYLDREIERAGGDDAPHEQFEASVAAELHGSIALPGAELAGKAVAPKPLIDTRPTPADQRRSGARPIPDSDKPEQPGGATIEAPDQLAPEHLIMDDDGGAGQQQSPVGSIGSSKSKQGKPRLRTTVTDTALAAAFERNQAALRRCYETSLKDDPTLRGELVFQLETNAAGEVTSVEQLDARADVVERELGDCLRQNIRTWKLELATGKHPDGLTTRLPIQLEPG